ncbi:GAF domain-containing sensor histidine kinase [Bradyrhizobium roseum]|uniref:GAF domain-containing sensor histidine kinase n=1 Tax=Bradyrhizobium roseum TaxID=3056648 RepID=UPI002606F39E|nr:GAF domain-containing sensor histidine kinase [Bradyrhizobium roseus]WKA31356.1 GAF domain-containing sensor histidine kinase [Bradyrhizobium roseus]
MEGSFQADIDAIQRIDAVSRILNVVCRVTGMGFAAVARVTEQRWICCAVRDEIQFGLKPGGELKVETTICHEIRQSHKAVVIDHVAEDQTFCGHHTPAMYGFQSYISVPIILADGTFFGTLCAIDPRPARLNNPETIETFKLFAELIGSHLDAVDRLAQSEASLLDERQSSELREQFIAVLGHDLRNPLASIAAGARLIGKKTTPEAVTEIADLMQASVNRMSRLIDNILDFARGRLGGGLSLERTTNEPLQPILEQVIAELHSGNSARTIEASFDIRNPVYCDVQRIGQLFSNLLGNAIAHGAPDMPVRVRAATYGSSFELSVANSGEPISPAAMERLFQPFYRGQDRASLQGLGLGLFIASEIAKAHGGTMEVDSNAEETRFTFQMPTALR